MNYCEECGKILKEGEEIWLELSIDDGNYYTDNFPVDHKSQGLFPFGKSCAKRVRKS